MAKVHQLYMDRIFYPFWVQLVVNRIESVHLRGHEIVVSTFLKMK